MKRGYQLVLLTAVISGFSVFLNSFGVVTLNPYLFTGLKNAIVAAILTGIVFAASGQETFRGLNKKQWLFLIAIGVIGGGIPFLLFFKGLSLTSAAEASFIHKSLFIYVAFLASVFLKEKIERKFIIGAFLLFLGSLFLLKKLPFVFDLGDLLVATAVLFWAAENVISKYLLKELSAKIIAWGRMFFGTIFIFLFLLLTNQIGPLARITFAQFSWIALTSIFLLCYIITWYHGLKDVPVSQASAILLLGSPITTALSFLALGKATFGEFLAGVLVIVGVGVIIGIKPRFLTELRICPRQNLDS